MGSDRTRGRARSVTWSHEDDAPAAAIGGTTAFPEVAYEEWITDVRTSLQVIDDED